MTPVSATLESTDASPSAPSLSDEIAGMMGELPGSDGETPEPESTSAEGTTPSEPSAGTEQGSESDKGAETESATAVTSAGTTPETPDTKALDETDPFADTTPATFNVNGVPVINEDIRVFKEGGAVIRPEALPAVLNKLSERESLFERNRVQSQEYQTLSKVTEWTTSEGKQYTGPEAAIEMRIGNAALLAENKLLVDVLTDPAKLYSILTTEQVADGQGGVTERVILSPAALANLQRENALTVRELTATIRDHFKGVIAESTKPQAAPINYEGATQELISEIAKSSSLDASVLTAKDRADLAEQLPFHIKDGLASVAWQNLVKKWIGERIAQKANTQTVVSTTEKAVKEGQLRMAAAARGVKPNVAARLPVTPAKPVTPENERAAADSDAWDIMERASANAMRQRA